MSLGVVVKYNQQHSTEQKVDGKIYKKNWKKRLNCGVELIIVCSN